MDLSVIIATRDRAASLERTLACLQRSCLPASITWEVVVADNGSSDGTDLVAAESGRRSLGRVRYVQQTPGGKSAALNRAIQDARGAIIAFTDDDVLPDSEWLSTMAREFAGDPALAVLGGRIELADPRDLPTAIRTSRDRAVITRATFDITFPPIIGCNMAFRASVLRKLGGFDETLGPGTAITSSEDVDVVYRALRAGYHVTYVPEALVLHHHGRRTVDDRARAMRTYLRGRGAFYAKYAGRDWRVARQAAAELFATLRDLVGGSGGQDLGPRERLGLLLEGSRLYRAGRITAPRP